jgi:hypothetical protein
MFTTHASVDLYKQNLYNCQFDPSHAWKIGGTPKKSLNIWKNVESTPFADLNVIAVSKKR